MFSSKLREKTFSLKHYMRFNKKFFFFATVIILVLININLYVYPFFGSSKNNIEHVEASSSLKSDELIYSFSNNENISNSMYTGKILEVVGDVKEISFLNDRNTIILHTSNKKHGVICDVNKSEIEKFKSLKIHQQIKVKGICKGFLEDVILLNCYIDLKPNE